MGIVVDQVTLEKGLKADFLKAFANGENPADVMPFITETSSSSNQEKYGWLGQAPSMSEWLDERKLKGLLDFDYTIPNRHYEATIQFDQDDFDDDQLGAVQVRVGDLARKARLHPRKLFYELLVAGTADLAYDGLPFFSASHVEGDSGTQSNIVTGTGVTLAQLSADLESGAARLKSFLDDRGEPYYEGDLKLHVVCPLGLEWKFKQLNSLELISNTSNAFKGAIVSIISSARLTDADDWYLANNVDGVKPIIKQNRKNPEFVLGDKGDRAFMSNKIPAGVDYRVGMGYGLWQKMVKVTN